MPEDRSNKRKRTKSKQVLKKSMYTRLKVVFAAVVLGMLFIVGRMIFLYETKGVEYSNAVLTRLTYTGSSVPYQRGTITDRSGLVLAYSEEIYNVVIDATVVFSSETNQYEEPTIKALSENFDLDYQELKSKLESNTSSKYLVLAKGVGYDSVKKFKEFAAAKDKDGKKVNPDVKGVWFELNYKRTYPYDSLASHVIGFVVGDGDNNYGIENTYNQYLDGVDGRSYGYYDNELNIVETKVDAKNGGTVVTSIDVFCQRVVEDTISDFLKEYKVNNIGVILMNPNTGEIYAMASNKGFDLNNPRDLSNYYTEEELGEMTDTEQSNALNKMWRNFAVCDTYEPGSTYKLVTVSAALEEKKISTDDMYDCGGYKIVYDYRIRCSNRNGHGPQTLTKAIGNSCNIALMDIGEKLGSEKFCKYQKLLHFGSKTGIDLPGEQAGILIDESSMGPTELATSSFGQSFNVTMVQLASAYSSLVNGGYYYRPHVVNQVIDDNGVTVYSADDTLMKLTVSSETSEYMREATEKVVTEGTASQAAVEGYRVGGKTGTAQKGNRDDHLFVVSFVGSVPANNPQLVSYVVIDQIDDPVYYNTSRLATRMTSDILSRVLPQLGIYPEEGDIDYNLGEFEYEDEVSDGVDMEEYDGTEGDGQTVEGDVTPTPAN